MSPGLVSVAVGLADSGGSFAMSGGVFGGVGLNFLLLVSKSGHSEEIWLL